MTNQELADIIFPNITKTIEDYRKIYPKRNLPDGAVVSRFAPSPTGFVHMGSLLASFIEQKVPRQTNGVFYSHQGLTYGGLVMSQRCKAAQVRDIFVSLVDYLRGQGFSRVVYKHVPWV